MKQHKKNRLMLILIFGMSIIPFLIALFFNGKAPFIQGKVNNGELIIPVVTTEHADFGGLDEFSAKNINELQGHWLLVNIVPNSTCVQACLDAIYKTKQLQLMMNKDLTRIRRVVLVLGDTKPKTVDGWLQDDKVLLKIKPSLSLVKKLAEIRRGTIPEGMLMLMDPLGNLMMQYEPGFDPYKVKSDLMHLLKISQIG